MTTTEYDGRQIVGATMRLIGAGDGLSQAIKLKGGIPDFHLGDRAMLVHNAELVKLGIEPAVKDDLDGDLLLVMTWRALDGLTTDAPAVRKLLVAHAKKIREAQELEGQQVLLDDAAEDDEALEDQENRLAAEEAAAKGDDFYDSEAATDA